MISSAVKNSWNWNFADFRDLGLNLPGVLSKKLFLKISEYLQENTCARVSFQAAALLERDSGTEVFLWI